MKYSIYTALRKGPSDEININILAYKKYTTAANKVEEAFFKND